MADAQAILLRAFFGPSEASLIFGVLLPVVGLYYFFKAAPKKG
jgi:hypothetical protein